MKMRKRSVSPVIATILLISIVIVLAIIVFIWAKGFIGEAVTKKDAPAEQMCGEVSLDVQYLGEELQIINVGTVYIYKVNVIKISGGDEEVDEGAIEKLGVGSSEIINVGSYDKIKAVPVILGESNGKKIAYTCKDNIFTAE